MPKSKTSVLNQNVEIGEADKLKELIAATVKLWRKYHLTYDQAGYVGKEIRRELKIKRVKSRKNVIIRLSRDEEQKLIGQAYRETSTHGLLLKTLFLTGARVSEFVSLKVADLFFDEQMILIEKGKGGKSRYVPILPELAQELKTYLGSRKIGYIFESNRHTKFTTRRIQQIVKETAGRAGITKKVHPHLLRHTVATFLLENGMPLEQIQKFLGHSKIETTQIYAESSTEMMKAGFQKAFSN
jgi:integrase/recombinase XerD